MLANTSGCKLLGIINPNDVVPSFLLNLSNILVSSGFFFNNKNVPTPPLSALGPPFNKVFKLDGRFVVKIILRLLLIS